MKREELRAKLLAKAEAAIDEILAKQGPTEQMTMRDIETLALDSGRRIEEAMVEVLTHEHESKLEMVCEVCGGRMHYKGKRLRDVVTAAGETRFERAYYYCARCKVGRFPPG